MRKLILAASAAAVMAACVGVAAAQTAEGGHGRHGGMLFQSDSNQDGVLTRAEYDAGRAAAFARLDANSDGSISAEERRASRRAMFEQMRERAGEHRAERSQARWTRQDANGDGVISREEYLARPNQAFDRLDANSDGNLSADERPQPRERGQRGQGRQGVWGDTDNDGAISRAEYDAQGAALFQRLDANGDGQVTQEEAAAARPHRRTPA